jgi:hypothetical protein
MNDKTYVITSAMYDELISYVVGLAYDAGEDPTVVVADVDSIINGDKEDTKDPVCKVPPILPRRSGRYPWGQSTNVEDSNKEDKKDE